MSLPMVSIIIPCYNYRQYVGMAIETCMQQQYDGKFELIVVDDGSIDGSIQACKFYETVWCKDKYKVIRLTGNHGYSFAKNEGIAASRGEYITCLDADDMMTIDSIQKRAEILDQRPDIMLVHAKAYVINANGNYEYWNNRIYKIDTSKSIKIQAQTVMVKREVYQKYGLYDELLRSRSDNEMWWRLRNVAHIEDRFYHLDQPVAFYRKHELSMVEYRKKNPLYNQEVTSILEQQKELRAKEGITDSNTRMLRT